MCKALPITKEEVRNKNVSLSDLQVYDMRTSYRAGESMRKLSARYKCSLMCVQHALYGHGAYKNV